MKPNPNIRNVIFIGFFIFFLSGISNLAFSKVEVQMTTIASKEQFVARITDNASATFNAQNYTVSHSKKIKIHRPGASFIKVHFSRFSIPDGSQVVVSNSGGSQSHILNASQNTAITLNSVDGDDGKNSFSVLSIVGDVAVIEYLKGASSEPYSIHIDYFMQGYSQEIIEALMEDHVAQEAGPLSTCGVNERRDVQCWANSHPVEFERSRPVARLLFNGSGLCTAWRVGSGNHLFTNNHCVNSQSEVANAEVWFNYQRTACGSGSANNTTIVSGDVLLATNGTLDYTLFTVNNFSSLDEFGYFGLDVRDAINGERIYIPQHGAGNPKELSIESDQNSGGVCRVDDNFRNGNGTNTDIGYYCDTIGGSSGSPVVAASSNAVIALHHFGGCLNQGVRIADIWPQVSSFFEGEIPVGDNGNDPDPDPDPTPGPDPDPDTLLKNGQVVRGLSGEDNSEQFFVLDVPANANNVRFVISGGSGDADLYVRVGDRPSTGIYDCRPYVNGNEETCNLPAGTTGKVYVMLQGYTAFSGVSLEGSYREDGGDNPDGSGSETDLSGDQGTWQHFTIEVPAGVSKLTTSISGGGGDADLYIRFGQQPTRFQYDCRPYINGNNESCEEENPRAGTWYLSLRGYRDYSGVTLAWRLTSNN